MVAVVGSTSVVTVWTTVVAGSVTVSFTVGGTVVGTVVATLLGVTAGEERRGDDACDEQGAERDHGNHPAASAARRDRGKCADCRLAGGVGEGSRSAWTRSAAISYRCSGSLASPRARASSTCDGSSGLRLEARGIGSLTCAIASTVEDWRSNGLAPVSSSNATTASA